MLDQNKKLKDELMDKVQGGTSILYEDGIEANEYAYLGDGYYVAYVCGNNKEVVIGIETIYTREYQVFNKIFNDLYKNQPNMIDSFIDDGASYKVIGKKNGCAKIYMTGMLKFCPHYDPAKDIVKKTV